MESARTRDLHGSQIYDGKNSGESAEDRRDLDVSDRHQWLAVRDNGFTERRSKQNSDPLSLWEIRVCRSRFGTEEGVLGQTVWLHYIRREY